MFFKRGTAYLLEHCSQTLPNRAPTAISRLEPIQHRLGNQKLLASAYIILRLRFDKGVRREQLEVTALNFLRGAIRQPVGYISEHCRLQCERGSCFAPLDQRTTAQAIHRFEHLSSPN